MPQIATSWKYLDDNTIEFQIRDGVTFQDGSKLTADDVAFSINRIIDPALKSPQFSQFNTDRQGRGHAVPRPSR